ncbi:MAG: hypothetical protein WKF79_08035 [Nocardioides sp.]
MSIDGGHTAEVTRHDLRLAEACVGERGLVVLDDLLNPHWMGVLSGLASYLTAEHRLIPLAFSPNKLYLATSEESATAYAEHLATVAADLLGKQGVEFFGRTVDVYGQGSAVWRRRAAEFQATSLAAAEVAELREQLADERRRRRRVAGRLAAAQDEVAQLRTSTSWRVTAPLRRVRRPGRR